MATASAASLTELPTATVAAAARSNRGRTVLLVCPDSSLRERLRHSLAGLRWHVLEAPCGAEAWMAAQSGVFDAMLVDPWLPDLEITEFLAEFHQNYPQIEILTTDGAAAKGSLRSPYHQELLYALRRSQDGNTVAWNSAPALDEPSGISSLPPVPSAPSNSSGQSVLQGRPETSIRASLPTVESGSQPYLAAKHTRLRELSTVERIPELIGTSSAMLEISRRIRLVADRATPVLIEGPTGSGKELVAEALHRLSSRSRKAFVAINCAAIPEALLEAELFGHTRGAFTGAVQGRTGRIEAADGGTLFLDEIGEMPFALQAKLLRFFESGELQRIGDNETVKVDVRVVAATHQPLAEDAQKGNFRADLYYRLAVFLIRTPALAEHMEDLPQLVAHFLEQMGRKAPVKRIDGTAMMRLASHHWPGNVRELEHVLERAAILAGDDPVIGASEIDFGLIEPHGSSGIGSPGMGA
jgi:DNA-binding NtrC family response regulator